MITRENSGMTWISRRHFLGSAALFAATRKLKVVVTGGHPGDPEYGCGGTVARFVGAEHEVVLLGVRSRIRPRGARDGWRRRGGRVSC